jgi:integrase/recombinase XerD
MEVSVARERYIHWLFVARDLSPNTRRAYDGDIAAFEAHLGAGSTITNIDRERLVAFVESQRAAGLSSLSVRRRACAVRGFCRWLRSAELLDTDPWVDIPAATGRPRQLPRVVPPHELAKLLAYLCAEADIGDQRDARVAIRDPHAATTLLAVAIMLTTGVRVHEVVGLRCPDLDLASRSLRLLGKGRREREVYLTNDWVTCIAGSYLRIRELLAPTHDHLLFNRALDPLTAPAMRGRLAKAARDAGLRSRVTPHMLRHSAATQLIEAGVDIRYIQRLLGHASLATTEIYTHVSNPALRRAVTQADVLGRLSTADN